MAAIGLVMGFNIKQWRNKEIMGKKITLYFVKYGYYQKVKTKL